MDDDVQKAAVVGLVGLLVIGGTVLAVNAHERKKRTRAMLQSFARRASEFEQRLSGATSIGPRLDSSKYARIARRDPNAALAEICADVHAHITWVSDWKTHRVNDFWQTAEETVRTRQGDCEDKAIVARELLESIGFRGVRVVVGAWNGEGHAWLETEDGKFFMDPTAGTLGNSRPSAYEPALWLGGRTPMVNAALLPNAVAAVA